jgi:DNA invertase Pin-like site-specific DNA recombinase
MPACQRMRRSARSEEHPRNDDGAKGLRAAQYVRMSTDHQKYSIENQAAAIAAYAAHRNITIVRTYADHGRSGVRIDGREELQRLIKDVRSRQTDFTLILVYDISRWGRFQDADEAAYYEFLCKEAGIRVLYCAEQFENDGSLVSAILKNMKRVMAGEYSRDLSTKVSTGQMRGASLGFWQGGPAGYGMRLQLVDEYGAKKAVLEYGQRKSLKADRTILVPGPKSEINVVKRIFDLFVHKRKTRTEIAAKLNAGKIYNARGRLWTSLTIDNILKNEKYIGLVSSVAAPRGLVGSACSIHPKLGFAAKMRLPQLLSLICLPKHKRYVRNDSTEARIRNYLIDWPVC